MLNFQVLAPCGTFECTLRDVVRDKWSVKGQIDDSKEENSDSSKGLIKI